MKAPFPYFGGKSRVAGLVWRAFGDVPVYIEPFCGSAAVLLARPTEPRIETVNDIDCMIANFYRAIQSDPEQVAHWADGPVNEADLCARHLWLVSQEDWRERMKTDPDHYDAKIAGWWVWGISQWIAGGWCAKELPRRRRPQVPHNSAGVGVHRNHGGLVEWFGELSDRLRRVRVCCGDWKRITGPACLGVSTCGVFLDPPYAARRSNVYNNDSYTISHEVRAWALEHAHLRVALCGYEGEHEMPGWTKHAWKAGGGYTKPGSTGHANKHLERIWFSPSCLAIEDEDPQGLLWYQLA